MEHAINQVSDEMLDKISKIVALAERGGTEEEATTAMEMAQKLLAKYNLTLADVQERELAEKDPMECGLLVETEADGRIRLERWAVTIGAGVGALYFCKYVKGHAYRTTPSGSRVWYQLRHYFIGRRSNTAVAKVMTRYLVDTVLRLSKEAGRTCLRSGARRAAYERDFRDGAALRLYERCHAIAAGKLPQGSQATNLPALYRDRLQEAEEFSKTVFTKTRTSHQRMPIHGHGYWDGREAAENISLNEQLDRQDHRKLN